jgi:nucleoside 2-deoxyribosyltransferase
MPDPYFYLAGPMRGHKEYNFPRFTAACVRLRRAGLNIVSPHEMDLDAGFNPKTKPVDVDLDTLREMLERDMIAVLHSDGVIVLPSWETSAGARAEVSLAFAAGIPVYTIEQALQYAMLATTSED